MPRSFIRGAATSHAIAAMDADSGIVRIHAQTMRPGHPPPDRGQALGGAHAHDGAGDGVRGADGDAADRRADEHHRARRLRAEAAHRAQLGEAHAHRLDDAPAAGHGAEPDGGVSGQDHPHGHVELRAEVSAREEEDRDDPHGLLGVVGAVPQAVRRRREQLQSAEQAVHAARPESAERSTGWRPSGTNPSTSPITGASTMKTRILPRPGRSSAPKPALATAAPT